MTTRAAREARAKGEHPAAWMADDLYAQAHWVASYAADEEYDRVYGEEINGYLEERRSRPRASGEARP